VNRCRGVTLQLLREANKSISKVHLLYWLPIRDEFNHI